MKKTLLLLSILPALFLGTAKAQSLSGGSVHPIYSAYSIDPDWYIPDPDMPSNDVQLYPNPCDDVLHMEFGGNILANPTGGGTDKIDIKIYDLSGNILQHVNYDVAPRNIDFPTSDLPPGMYFYQIINKNETIRDKFVKE